MTRYAFDLYPRDDPGAGTRLVRFSQLQSAEYRKEANGTGIGKLSLRGTSTDAAFIDPAGLQYVRVVLIENDLSETVYGGFFLENGDFAALTKPSSKLLTFTGAGTLSVLQRAIAAEESYLSADDPVDGEWPWSTQTPGEILDRMIREAQAAGRPQDPLSMVTHDFDGDVDSAAVAWAITDVDFRFQVGRDLLDLVRQFMAKGLHVDMDGDFLLHAWQTRGTDRTGVAWGAGVVRFQSPTDGTIATGNILSDAKRGLAAFVQRSDILIGNTELGYAWVPGSVGGPGLQDIDWEGFIPDVSDPNSTASTAVSEAQLAARDDAGDTVRLRIRLGESPSNGAYAPGLHFDVADTVTLHTGSGTWDWDETEQTVAAITLILRDAADWDALVDLGSQYSSIESRAFTNQPVGAHTHSPNPRICRGGTGADILAGTARANIKVSSEESSSVNPREDAVDGDLGTVWDGQNTVGVPNEYWAADLLTAKSAASFRLRTQFPALTNNFAASMALYGSNDAAAWAWLPTGKIVADPTANGWTLVSGYTGASVLPVDESDEFTLVAYRYWMVRALTGAPPGANTDWDINELNLYGGCSIEDVGDVCSDGIATCVAAGDHVHSHPLLDTSGPYHSAATITETVDGNVQAALDALRVGVGGEQTDFLLSHRFLLNAHRGDIGSADSYPENTLEAAIQAWVKGAPLVECDVHLTSDGVWVVMHDSTTDRTTTSSSNITSLTAATFVGLTIDGGFGYDAGRHTSPVINPPTLAALIEAAAQYGGILEIEPKVTSDANYTSLATAIVATGLEQHARVTCVTTTAAAAVKAVSSAITTMVHVSVDPDPENDPAADWAALGIASVTAAAVQARAPLPIATGMGIADYGTDESAELQTAWDAGARTFGTNSLDAALALIQTLLYGAATADHIADPTDAHDASSVSIADAGGYFTATETEGALQELGDAVDSLGGATGIGEILIADIHSTPLIFADLLQNEAQDDLVYADL